MIEEEEEEIVEEEEAILAGEAEAEVDFEKMIGEEIVAMEDLHWLATNAKAKDISRKIVQAKMMLLPASTTMIETKGQNPNKKKCPKMNSVIIDTVVFALNFLKNI